MGVPDVAGFADALRRRLMAERSAEFLAWVSLGNTALVKEDLFAHGMTDFVDIETRAVQRPLALAVMREGRAKARTTIGNRVILGSTLWALDRAGVTRGRDFFYRDGQRWELRRDGDWRRWGQSRKRAGFRNGADPTLVLESLSAPVTIDHQSPGPVLDGTTTTLITTTADLSAIDERLKDFLDAGDSRRAAKGWYETTSVTLCVDETQLLRRISWAPLAPNTELPLWWTLQLSNFGAQLDRPPIDDDHG